MERSARESRTFTLECVILLLFTAALSLAMWTLHRVDSDMLVLSIIDNKDDTSAGTLELVDESRAVVWSQKLNEHALRRLEKLEPETLFAFAADEELTWSETSDDLAPFRRRIRSNSAEVKRIALDGARLVRCDRLKPRARGKYLTTPSLYALQACYRHGQRLDEPTTSDEQRLDLGRLYVGCEDVFGAELDELTDELRKDYIKCKSSGALTDKQQLLLEKRFGEQLIIDDHPTESENVQTSPISSTRDVLDPRAFVECGHMEIELFEDNFESPSYEALQRCHYLGVTYSELKLGIATNPRPNVQRFDLGNLYVSCRDVFNGNIDYITAELKDDYRRCKSVGAIDEEMQRVLEKKFLNSLYEKYGRAKKVEKKPSTTTSATSSSSVYETTSIVTTSISSNVSSSLGSSKRPDTNRYAFANCKRIENKAYIICIKVIKVYSTPIQYI